MARAPREAITGPERSSNRSAKKPGDNELELRFKNFEGKPASNTQTGIPDFGQEARDLEGRRGQLNFGRGYLVFLDFLVERLFDPSTLFLQHSFDVLLLQLKQS